MFRATLTAALLTAPATALGGPPGLPSGPPPQVMILNVERDGTAYLTRTVTRFKEVTEVFKVRVGDKEETRQRKVVVPYTEMDKAVLSDKGVQVFNSDGKRLVGVNLPKFVKSVPVLVSADGKPVDPFYFRLAREGTLIIVAPALASLPGGSFTPLRKIGEVLP